MQSAPGRRIEIAERRETCDETMGSSVWHLPCHTEWTVAGWKTGANLRFGLIPGPVSRLFVTLRNLKKSRIRFGAAYLSDC